LNNVQASNKHTNGVFVYICRVKQLPVYIALSLLLTISLAGCSVNRHTAKVSNPDHKPGSLQTPEPGTRIDPIANLILYYGNGLMDNPDSIYGLYEKKLEKFKPGIHEMVDTSLLCEGYAIPIRIYYPVERLDCIGLPIIFFIHGGGFIWGNNEVYDGLNRKLAKVTRCIVVSVEYRLAPDYPFPVGLNDAWFAFQWVAANAASLGGSPSKILIIGDSAGGNLATVLCLMSRDKQGPAIAGQVLYYPSTTLRDTLTRSREYFLGLHGRYFLLNENFVRKVKEVYLCGQDDHNPYVSPLEANLSANLPPALIITAQCDPLRDEGKLYTLKLQHAGVSVKYHEYRGMIHGFVSFYPLLRDGRRALRETRKFVNEQFKN
jgi:acetyl esterase